MSDFDLTVVGAGIVGTQVAYQARRRHPEWKIVLLDRSLAGDGVTRYSGGLDHPFGWTPEQRVLAAESLELYAQLKHDVPEAPFFDLPLYGISRREQESTVLARFTKPGARQANVDELISLQDTYGPLQIDDDRVVITGCRGGYGDAPGIVNALVRRLRRMDHTAVWEGVDIRDVSSSGDGHTLRAADGRSISSKRVVVATGPWMLDGPGAQIMQTEQIRIKKIVALHLEMAPTMSSPILFFLDDDSYLLPVPHRNHWIFSFPSQHWDCPPEIRELTISADDRTHGLGILARYSPELAQRCTSGRVFCDAYSTSRLPVIAAVPGAPGYAVAGACSGFGFRLAPSIARRALDLVSVI